jgi:hypothetical protein
MFFKFSANVVALCLLCILSFSAGEIFAQVCLHLKVFDDSTLHACYHAELRFQRQLQGEHIYALHHQLDETRSVPPVRGQRSPVLAGAFSAILPGAGEFYAESYLRAGLFLALEVVLWALHLQFLDRGNRAALEYKAFADSPSELNDGLSRWSAVRYASRLAQIFREHPNAQLRTLSQELSSASRLNEIRNHDYRFLNAFERQAVFATGVTFSHTLSPFGSQQYYELIGKYSEYAIGWDDFDTRQLSNSFPPASQHFLNYGIRRQEFNDILNRATTVSYFIILNHILSVVDAVLATNEYNRRFTTTMEMRPDPITGALVPHAKLQVRF